MNHTLTYTTPSGKAYTCGLGSFEEALADLEGHTLRHQQEQVENHSMFKGMFIADSDIPNSVTAYAIMIGHMNDEMIKQRIRNYSLDHRKSRNKLRNSAWGPF